MPHQNNGHRKTHRSESETKSDNTISTRLKITPDPMPWKARPASIVLQPCSPCELSLATDTYSIFVAAPHIAEPAAKKSSPPSRMGLRPKTLASPPDLPKRTVKNDSTTKQASLPGNDECSRNAICVANPTEIGGFQRMGDCRKCGTDGFVA
jgi:hypothetical protein